MHKLFRSKSLQLLVSLLLILILGPFLSNGLISTAILNFFFTMILVSGLYAVSEDRRHLMTGLLIGVPTLLASWVVLLLQDPFLNSAIFLVWTIFDAIVAYDILRHVLQHPEVSLDTIYGAVSVYLLIGIIFGAMYVFLEGLNPGSFIASSQVNPDGVFTFPELFYFSFTTIATLGYGDIVPIAPLVRSLAVIEAIVGAMYIAILIGVLIGAYVNKSRNSKNAPR